MWAWELLWSRHNCSKSWFVLFLSDCHIPWAKTATTKTLIRNDINNAIVASIKKYLLASLTWCFLVRSISLDWTVQKGLDQHRTNPNMCLFQLTLTSAEWRYRLCGIITAPTIPTAWSKTFLSQSEHHGTNNPFITCPWSGATLTY